MLKFINRFEKFALIISNIVFLSKLIVETFLLKFKFFTHFQNRKYKHELK